MDPCPFVRILVGNLALKFPASSNASSSSYFCKIKLDNFPLHTSSIPLISQENQYPDTQSHSLAAKFSLDREEIKTRKNYNPCLKISVYRGGNGVACGLNSGAKLLGRVSVPLDLSKVESKARVFHNGWISIGESKNKMGSLFLTIRAEPDPRFVFEFDGEPECSPQVFQVQGNLKQSVFSCNFSFRNSGDRSSTCRSSMSEAITSRNWLPSLGTEKEQYSKERKGWSITIHDLSGSPVAAASMVTPFVPSPGSDRVSRSNPGAWLILRPGDGTWKPWGRLEAWREAGCSKNVGYRFELDGAVVNSAINAKTGGKFTIDMTTSVSSPVSSAHSSFDLGSGSGSTSRTGSGSSSEFGLDLAQQYAANRGFVMSSTVEKCGKPKVEVGVAHVSCAEDAAAFVALAAAVDLSVDACKPFSEKLRRELRHGSQEFTV